MIIKGIVIEIDHLFIEWSTHNCTIIFRKFLLSCSQRKCFKTKGGSCDKLKNDKISHINDKGV